MAGETVLTVVGNVGSDPELRFTPSGQAVANFSLCQTPRTFDKQTNEWTDGEPNWFRVNVWQQMAEHVAESVTKGMRLVVTGKLVIRKYETSDGTKGTSVELTADEVGVALRYGSAKFTKAERSGGQGGGQQQAASRQPVAQDNPWQTGPVDEPPF